MNFKKTYFYYKNLDFKNYENWNDNDLSSFLIWDFYDAFNGTENFKKVPDFFNRKIIKKNKIQAVCNTFDYWLIKVNNFFKKNKKKKFLFQNYRQSYIVSAVKKRYSIGVIEQGKKNAIFLRKDFFGGIHNDDLDNMISLYLETKNIKILRRFVEKIKERLEVIKPDYVVLAGDIFPFERAIVLACNKLGIITFAIQQGIYDLSIPLVDFKAADYVLVWGKYFKDLYVNNGVRDSKDIFILGYPKKITKFKNINKKCKVCYLGQNYEEYNESLLKNKIEALKKIWKICKKYGMDFFYRPHPFENRDKLQSLFPEIKFTSEKQTLKDTLKISDIFISFSSTSLVEASMQGKITIQLLNYPIETDNFENLGACTKTVKNITELEEYLSQDLNKIKPDFNNDYVETRQDPAQRFFEIIEKIENKKIL